MRNTPKHPAKANFMVWLLLFSLCLGASGALADGMMPIMEPPKTAVYWQLVGVALEPTVRPSGGYAVEYATDGLSLDLSDGLMAESLLQKGETPAPSVSLSLTKGDKALSHAYAWTAPPIYLEPGVVYSIEIKGEQESEAGPLNSLLGTYVQGDLVSRISAGGYTGHPDAAVIEVSPHASGVYVDGSYVVSFVLRDVNDMFRLRVSYQYAMQHGVKPEPTPIPGYVPVEVPAEAMPGFYEPVPGKEALFTITTAPDQYRAYGSMSGSEPMFFPATAEGVVAMDEKPVDPKSDFHNFVEGFVPTAPEALPPYYQEVEPGVYGLTTRDGETVLRVHGRVDGGPDAFYSAETGQKEPSALTPVNPADDYTQHIEGFGAAQPPEVPAHYQPIGENLYGFTGRDGETRLRTYGRLDGSEPAFFPADEKGNVEQGAQPVSPQEDFDSYIKGFDAVKPAEVPPFYKVGENGLFTVTDREGNPVKRVYGVLDGKAPAFYEAGPDGQPVEGATPVDPEADFERYIAGFEPADLPEPPAFYEATDVPGVWSFVDVDGQTQYRAYGSLNRGEPQFYPSDAEGNVARDALPVQPASDLARIPPPKFEPAAPGWVPPYYTIVEGQNGVYAFEDANGEPIYRVFGAYGKKDPGFYPANAEGTPIPDAGPVTPEGDLSALAEGFTPQTPAEFPPYYIAVEGEHGLYAFEDKAGQKVFRVYGARENGAAGFYPADAEGNPIAGKPADPSQEIQLLPTPMAYSIVTPGPVPASDATPLVRTGEGGEAWIDPSQPMPTSYASGVVPQTTGAGATQQVITRDITPKPDPTAYDASVTAQPTGIDGQQVVTRDITPKPDPTKYDASVTVQPTGTDGQGVIQSEITAGPSPTKYDASVTVQPTGTDGQGVVQSDITASPEATKYDASVTTQPTGADGKGLVTGDITPGPASTAYNATVSPAQTAAGAEATPVLSVIEDGAEPVDATVVDTPTNTPVLIEGGTQSPAPGGTTGTLSTQTSAEPKPSTETSKDPTQQPAETVSAAPTQTATEEPATEAPAVTETPAGTETPAATDEPAATSGGISPWWIALIVAGVAALGGGAFALRRRRG